LSLILGVALAAGCEGTVEEPGPCDLDYDLLRHLTISEVHHPMPLLVGSELEIRGESFITGGVCVALSVELRGRAGSNEDERDFALQAEAIDTNTIRATLPPLSAQDITAAGGSFEGVLVIRYLAADGPETFEANHDLSFEVVERMTPTASQVQGGDLYLNDRVVITGSGFLNGGEGSTEVAVEGTFTQGSDRTSVSLRLPTELVEATDRTRASFLWSPQIGGLSPGSFEGTITPENVHFSSERIAGSAIPLTARQQQTVLFSVTPDEVSLGQIADVVGRGFIGRPIGASGELEGSTIIRLEGVFTPHNGEPENATFDLFPTWVDGGLVRYTVTLSSDGGELRSVDFDTHRGRFEGSATPVLTMGGTESEGLGTDLTFTLGPVRQVVWVRFLSGFRDGLDLFGLGAVHEIVRRQIITRMQELYCPPGEPDRCVNVLLVDEQPLGYYDGGYAILDIGGADPNNLGLFGYDNTGIKDVGNLRLHDHVGGENALGAMDGYPYGGIFIDSILYYSEDPPFDDRPAYAPMPNPRFDDIFDPLRRNEVVADEYPDGATGDRRVEIEAAIDFVVNVVAEIGAHEFGHTLGLAQPDGTIEETHNPIPSDLCLMDSGPDRPMEERARLDGSPGSRFCDNSLMYLRRILPPE
jgi:hypothetical protein